MTKDVAFEPVVGSVNDLIDDAYRSKYRGSPYLDPMITARARAATVKVTSRAPKARRSEQCHTSSSNSGLGGQNSRKSVWRPRIAQDVMEVLNYGEESVSVGFEEIKSQDWKEKVYKPDVLAKWDGLYKKPGYKMWWKSGRT